jgi:hypothetical protein
MSSSFLPGWSAAAAAEKLIRLLHNNSRKPRWNILKLGRNGIFACTFIALLAGISICLIISPLGHRPEHLRLLPSPEATIDGASSIFSSPHDTEDLSLEELGNLVSRSNGYWARDYSLSLGWNNVGHHVRDLRYI